MMSSSAGEEANAEALPSRSEADRTGSGDKWGGDEVGGAGGGEALEAGGGAEADVYV